MSILNKEAQVNEPVTEGNYELPLTDIKEITNEKGGYVQLTFKDSNTEIIHNIFGSNEKQIRYTIQTLGRQVSKFGKNVSLKDVLIPGFIYKIYVSYNEYGRNVSFGVRETVDEEADAV